MKMSANGLEFLKEAEGCVLHVYKDQAGKPTIGVGHLLTPSERRNGVINIAGKQVIYAPAITMQQALDLLAQDVKPVEDVINEAVKVTLNQNQFDALVSFTFNVGIGGFRSSTALKVLNAGDYNDVPLWLAKWNKVTVDGVLKVCDDLVSRRAKECELWRTPV